MTEKEKVISDAVKDRIETVQKDAKRGKEDGETINDITNIIVIHITIIPIYIL